MDQSPLLGRCKDCDFALFATRDTVVDIPSFKDIKLAGKAYRVKDCGYFARCDQRHRFFVLKSVKGTYSADHKCDSRCLNAKGHCCTCSCGGVNHGRGHAITTHTATAKNPQHIGEVGKYIRGTATVVERRKHIGRYNTTLFIFSTSKLDIIKWFAPSLASDLYEVGQVVSFRAKVKTHEDHEVFGKSTIVTYLERIGAE